MVFIVGAGTTAGGRHVSESQIILILNRGFSSRRAHVMVDTVSNFYVKS